MNNKVVVNLENVSMKYHSLEGETLPLTTYPLRLTKVNSLV